MADKTLQRKLQIEQQERQPGVTSCVLDGQVVHVTVNEKMISLSCIFIVLALY
jgi:hypothetical protein